MRISIERKWTAHDKRAIGLQLGSIFLSVLLYGLVKLVVLNFGLVVASLTIIALFIALVFMTMFLCIGWVMFLSSFVIDRTLQGIFQGLTVLILGSALASYIFVTTAELVKITFLGV